MRVWLRQVIIPVALMATAGLVPLYGQTKPSTAPAATVAADAAAATTVVLKVGKEEVAKADMDFLISSLSPQAQQAIATRGRRAIGEQYALMILLSQQAASKHLDDSPAIRERLALERLQLLAQAEYQNIEQQVKVDPDEISQYYAAHKPDFEEAEVREIIVRKKSQDDKGNTPGLSPAEAKARVAAIQKALTAGTDIKKVEKEFGVPNVVMINSEPRAFHRGQLLPALDKAAFGLKEGQFSEPYETPQAIVLLQVVGHHQPDLKDVSNEIENELRQQKVEATVSDLKKSASIWMDDDYFKGESAPPSAAAEPATKKPVTAAPPKP